MACGHSRLNTGRESPVMAAVVDDTDADKSQSAVARNIHYDQTAGGGNNDPRIGGGLAVEQESQEDLARRLPGYSWI
jgi:hypothetical protein